MLLSLLTGMVPSSSSYSSNVFCSCHCLVYYHFYYYWYSSL